jgi:hypothetical protein
LLITELFKAFDYYNKYDEPMDEKGQQEYQETGKLLIKSLADIVNNTKKFPKEFLQRLIKHFGLENYFNVATQLKPGKLTSVWKKDKLDRFDVRLLVGKGGVWNYQGISQIFDNLTLGGKEMLRRYLFMDYSSSKDPFFMLDDELRPMDANYKAIPWPAEFKIIKVDEAAEPYASQWQKIFQEFNIIPMT